MVRPQITAGELGKVVIDRVASGRYRARASIRDDSGAPHRLAAVADTEDEARADVRRQAAAMSTGGVGALKPSSTIADAVELWLSQILTREGGQLVVLNLRIVREDRPRDYPAAVRGSAARPTDRRSL